MHKLMLGITVIAIIAIGVWYVISSQKDDTVTETNTTPTAAESATAPAEDTRVGQGSFASLLARGGRVRCTYTGTTEDGTNVGTMYTDGQRVRIESSHTSADGTLDTTMITDGSTTYTWGTTESGTMAIKMTNQDSTADAVASPESPGSTGVDMDAAVSYDCAPWSVDASLFVPPSDIEFTDMDAMLQGAFEGIPEGMTLPVGYPTP